MSTFDSAVEPLVSSESETPADSSERRARRPSGIVAALRRQSRAVQNAHRSAAELCRIVLESVDGFRGDLPQHDDMTLVIARVLPPG